MSYQKQKFIDFMFSKGNHQPGGYCNGLDNVERLFMVDIDKEFEKDECASLYQRIQLMRKSPEQIGKNEHTVRQYASNVKKYIEFRQEQIKKVDLFTWIPFYEEFATKLLDYKNRRKELLEIIKMCFEDLPFEYPFKEHGQEDYDDIDPFTIFGSFNKNMRDENRIIIANKYKKAFSIESDLPRDFTGIPVLMPLSAWFFAYKANRSENDIDNLWQLFETALALADGDTSKEKDFIDIYNQVITQRQVKWNITIGLYWVRPKTFLSLDSVSRAYLPEFNPPVGATISTRELPNGEEYLWDIKELKRTFPNGDPSVQNFYELSQKAFEFSINEDEYNSVSAKIIEIIKEYKSNFSKINEQERYKWEAIKHYKDNWDINAPDFVEMLKTSFVKHENLLTSNNYYAYRMLIQVAENEPEKVRNLFRILYDESVSLENRFDMFREGFDEYCKPKKLNSYQDLHAISVYLTFEYPEKYSIYKYKVWTDFLKNIGEPLPEIKGKPETFKIESSNKICDDILAIVLEDRELCSMSQSRLNNDCYDDPSFRLLAFDIMFFGSKYQNNELEGWWPSLEEYNPNLTKEDWKNYILEIELPDHPSPIQMLKAMMELGGEASCKQLSKSFGGSPNYYVGCTMNLGRRVKKHFSLPACMDGEQERYFPFPFLGKALDDQEGHQYLYKIRPELMDALHEIDLSDISPYYNVENDEAIESTEEPIEPYAKADFLKDVYISEEKYETCVSRLKHKKNLILQGAPGVGKTFAARRLAWSVMGVKNDKRIEFVQFHQSYSYEDFIMGYKPVGNGFSLEKGVFYEFCIKAKEDPDNDYFFIIDEINRGNMSKIFGELLMLIENDYRGTEITLAYDKKPFSVPENLYIIGMMNTADRSLAMIDYALRRRFSFVEMTPGFDSEGFETYQSTISNHNFGKLIGRIKALNAYIENDASLGKGFCIGHSYFCNLDADCSDAVLKEIVDYDIVPMLEEYWFDDEINAKTWSKDLSDVFNG